MNEIDISNLIEKTQHLIDDDKISIAQSGSAFVQTIITEHGVFEITVTLNRIV